MDYKKEVGVLTAKRDAEIVSMRKQGATLQAIGDAFDLSRERVRQILSERAVLRGAKP